MTLQQSVSKNAKNEVFLVWMKFFFWCVTFHNAGILNKQPTVTSSQNQI